jgi:DNA-binding response OmpR family regulator
MRPPVSAPRRILIVDDNPEIVMSLSSLLGMSGNTMFAARDGEEAISMAEQVRPEIILLDLGLPKLDGYEVCRRIRQNAWGKEMVIVALTGWGHDEARMKTRQSGFDMHLVKPLDPETLFLVLASIGPVTPTH